VPYLNYGAALKNRGDLSGARAAFEKAMRDPKPGVQAQARAHLAQLDAMEQRGGK
jgi:hypothetical protein